MPTPSRLPSSNPQPTRSKSLRSLSRTLLLITATVGLIGLSDAAFVGSHLSQPKVLTPQEWQEMKLDEYLASYPDGNTLSLSEYTQQLPHPFTLQCGIGKFTECQVPQPAYDALRARADWWIVTSTINWNYYTNYLAIALSSSAKLAQSIVHHMLRDLIDKFNPETHLGVITEMDLIRMLLYPIEHGGNRDPTVSDATQVPDWLAAISPLAANANSQMDLAQVHQTLQSAKGKAHLPSSATPPLILYNSNLPVETNLRALGAQLQHLLAQSVANKAMAPISRETGIYSAISGGRFAGPKIDTPRITSNGDDIMRLIGLSAILNHQNAMVVIRKSSCAQDRDEFKKQAARKLQFCASDSTLIEIVQVRENEIDPEFHNAKLIESKYGFKTSFLASEALRCHEATHQTDSSQHLTSGDGSPFDPCTFQLPICNLQDEYLQELLRSGKSIAQICREDVGLPI